MEIMFRGSPLDVVVRKERVKGKIIYSAISPKYDVGSQGRSSEEAVANLKEALELHLEVAERYAKAAIALRA